MSMNTSGVSARTQIADAIAPVFAVEPLPHAAGRRPIVTTERDLALVLLEPVVGERAHDSVRLGNPCVLRS